jgi:hypothetical protein
MVRHASTLGDIEEKEPVDDDAAPKTLNVSSPCVTGKFWSALETLLRHSRRRSTIITKYCHGSWAQSCVTLQ